MKGGAVLNFRKYIKTLSAALSAALIITGCEAEPPAPGETSTASTPADTSKTSFAALADEDDIAPAKEKQPLIIAFNEVNHAYTPFSGSVSFDSFMNEVTGERVVGYDRSGNIVMKGLSGERLEFMGAYYSYSGICDVEQEYDAENDLTTFSLQLRNGVKFSDGEQLTADDLIFTLYMLLDPSYKGSVSLYDTDIVGAVNYRLNSSIADTLTDEEIAEAMSTEEFAELIKTEIVIPVLSEEFRTVKTLYHDSAYDVYTNAYPDPKNLMTFFYSVDSEYRPDPDADDEQIIRELADMYGGNYALLGSMVAGEESFYAERARACAVAFITEQQGVTEDVKNVRGIIKTGEYRLTITVKGKGRSLLKALANVVIAPMHYYGDPSLYDYANDSFGFTKGSAAEITERKAGAPVGLGAYTCVKMENGTAILEANEEYYKGAPLIPEIRVISGSPADAVNNVVIGEADIAFPSYTPEKLREINKQNESIEKLYLSTARNNGYGYVGMNAQTVNINGEPMSEESVNMRKGIATAIDCFRAETVSAYYRDYGEAAVYPVCGNVTVAGYISPYELNSEGESIYEPDMTDSQREKAAKAQCLARFEAAGYTVDNGKITAAPEGAPTEFTVMIAGGGNGDHPLYTALQKASDLLVEIGVKLFIKDISDDTLLWEAISSGTHTIWAGSWGTSLKTAYTSGYYGIDQSRVNELIAATEAAGDRESLVEAYRNCYLYASAECAVEVPMYKRKTCVVFSSLRIDIPTLPQNMTNSYSWMNEIEKLNMK